MQLNKTYVEADWDGNSGVIGPIALNWRGGVTALQLTVTGTIDYDLVYTNRDLQAGETAVWAFSDAATHDGATTSLTVRYEATPRFILIGVNSSTDATVSLDIVQTDD